MAEARAQMDERKEEDKRAAQGVSLYQAQSNAQEEVLG